AMLYIKEGHEQEFVEAIRQAVPIISGRKGYIKHSLSKCMEETHKYLLLVEWETLEDHTEGFLGTSEYREWKALLHRFY
ncbi:antibiotic biosynthesis monooxygenase, partial [Bacillus vallismortis]|nr:antibiotic biosynthesis monooxygenase [Bacillus vallismortis]